MDTQAMVQAGAAFIITMTAVNVLISFIYLCVEERKKCSIMDKKLFSAEKSRYAVLRTDRRSA